MCRAAAGHAAPQVGTQVARGGGITGTCIATGVETRCTDTDFDARVNAAVCRELGIRSLLSVPLQCNNKVVGVIIATFEQPGAVDASTAHSLNMAAHQIVSRVYVECSGSNRVGSIGEEASAVDAQTIVSRVFPPKSHPVRAIDAAGNNTAVRPNDHPGQDSIQDELAATLQTANAQVALATKSHNQPHFILLDSSFASLDAIAEFLSRQYSVIFAIIIGCLLLVSIGIALKSHAPARGSGGRRFPYVVSQQAAPLEALFVSY